MAMLNELLAQMNGRLMTRGWDAIFSCNRVRLNYLLEQQYISRYEHFSFLPYIGGRATLGENGDYAEVRSLRLGTPRVSFERATLRDSTATVTMNIVAGEVYTWRPQAGTSARLLSRLPITEQHGFTVTMTVDLKVVVAEVDRQGRISLDLRGATRFACDLLGPESSDDLGAFFQEQFNGMRPDQTVFQLSRINLKGYRGLTPKSIRLRTQAEPGAKVRGAQNEGDGVVLALIEVRSGMGPGQELGEDFPILIPSDTQAGKPLYTASLVVSRDVLAHAVNGDLELPQSLSFPGRNLFEVSSTHTPHDWLAVGRISPASTSIVVEPTFSAIKAGQQQRFTLLDWQNRPITSGVTWTAVSLRSHSQEGHGTISSDGLYTSVSPQQIGYRNLDIVVTASYLDADGLTYSASALLRVDFEALEVAPALANQAVTDQASITLTAAAIGNDTVSCSLLPPLCGSLQKSALSQWVFTADAQARSRAFSLQRVLCQTSASGGQSTESLLILNNAQSFLRVEPTLVQRLAPDTSVQLRQGTALMPEATRRWRVLSGVGHVDQAGRYTAPPEGVTQSTVISCEIVRNGVVLFRDFVTVEKMQEEPEPTWQELAQFTIEVPNGPELGTQGRLLRNGYQQLRVRVTTRTQPVMVNGELKYFKLSLAERQSMHLAFNVGRQALTVIPADDEGIDDVFNGEWQVRKTPSRYFAVADPHQQSALQPLLSTDTTSAVGVPTADDSLSEQDFYLLTLASKNSIAVLSAGFQQDLVNEWHYSGEEGGSGTGTKVTVTAIDPGEFDYTLTRERIWGLTQGDLDDQMNLELNSGDFWSLKCIGQKFIALEYLPVESGRPEINLSSIRWESERPAEIMFSFTGSYFADELEPAAFGAKIKFDDRMGEVVRDPKLLDVDSPAFYEKGSFGILLRRDDNIPFIYPSASVRQLLDRDMAVALRDENGNLHERRIRFMAQEGQSARNMLTHSKFSA